MTAHTEELRAYFNDFTTAAWLARLYPHAQVDPRDIRDIRATDLVGHPRVHLFAGIGGWEAALQLAGWPADAPVWTASLPCQPFSNAGRVTGVLDERHLWPVVRALFAECRPAVCFGEQVASPAGRAWLAGVRADLEDLGYAVGAADLPAACVGAPHIRQRFFWVAHRLGDARTPGLPMAQRQAVRGSTREEEGRAALQSGGPWGQADLVRCADGKTRRVGAGIRVLASGVPGRTPQIRALANAIVPAVAAEFITAYLTTL